VLPSMQQSKIMRSLFEPPKGQKWLSFTKLAYMHVLTNVYQTKSWIFLHILSMREDFMHKFQLGHASLHMTQSSQRYKKASCMKCLHMHMNRHSRIKFKLIFRTTIAICFNSKSTHTHTHTHITQWCIIGHEIEMVEWSNN
jgi:hypothetical protein